MSEIGIIKKVTDRFFGFIQSVQQGDDLFFHYSDLLDSSPEAIAEGVKAEFNRVKSYRGGGGFVAKKVRLLMSDLAPLDAQVATESPNATSAASSLVSSSPSLASPLPLSVNYDPSSPPMPSTFKKFGNFRPLPPSTRYQSLSASSELPDKLIFKSFYGPDGEILPTLFFESAREVALLFEQAGFKHSQYRAIYKIFFNIIRILNQNENNFSKARELFGVMYVEKIEKPFNSGQLPEIVKVFFESHIKTALSSSQELAGFFRYATNVFCYVSFTSFL
ncbi:MAG: cold shock domain-containing protein [Deltaproteobacteria bacterium]|jgi:cold shock CspA family protein|nr:cold shock domain-containing protein [Deltaproteobacteria bacterium]